MPVFKIDGIKEGEVFCKWLESRLIRNNKNVMGVELGGTGCQPKGSKVLMADGLWKNIEDIKKGDFVLSPQKDKTNSFAKVISTTKWMSKENYDILQKNKEKKKLYCCSSNHIIPYFYKNKKGVWNYRENLAEEYSKFAKSSLSHTRIGFTSFLIDNFKGRTNCKIEPYTLGVFLGDGHFSHWSKSILNKDFSSKKRYNKKLLKKSGGCLTITSIDFEVLKEVSQYYPVMSIHKKKGTEAKSFSFGLNSSLSKDLKDYGLCNKNSGTKFIPKEVFTSNAEYRKRVLAGLIDTVGYYAKGRGGYSITLKSKQLIEDIKYLVYSLGGRCGKLGKVRKGIKSLGFVGTYYILNFYLGSLKLPLQLNRKVKDNSCVYLSSNRLAINSLNNNKQNMVYGFSLNSKSNFYITDNWMVTHNSGKSYRDLRKAELWYDYHFKEKFPTKNICFGIEQVMKRLTSKDLRRGEILIFEEAGVNLGSLDFQTKLSKMFTYILQSFRSMNIALFFNLPYFSMLNKSARMLMHYTFESAGIDFKTGMNKCKPKFNQVNQSTGKIYHKYMVIKYKGEPIIIKRYSFSMPNKELCKSYEDLKELYLEKLKQEVLEISNGSMDKAIQTNINPLTSLEAEAIKLLSEGKSQQEISKIMGCSVSNISRRLKSASQKIKNGFDVNNS